MTMEVFARADVGSRAPLWASDETAAAIFAGTPTQVAGYLATRMPTRPDAVALLTAELTHLASAGLVTDSLCLVLDDGRKVTIRP
jgi:tRNA (Thr-GGU) A37 N-methylase